MENNRMLVSVYIGSFITCQVVTEGTYLCLYTTSALDGSGWPTPCPDHFAPRKETQCPFTGGWVGLQASLDESRKSRPHQGSNPGPSSPEQDTIPTLLSWPTSV